MYEGFSEKNRIDVNDPSDGKTFQFAPLDYHPLYNRINNYVCFGTPILTPLEFTSWRDECIAAQETCAITSNLNPAPALMVSGPDALQFMKDNLVNNFDKFPVGRTKHGVMCADNGLIISNGVILRSAEDTFEAHWLSPYLNMKFDSERYDAKLEDITRTRFIFQLIGPKSLQIVEEACEDDFHDLKLCRFRESSMCGHKVRVLRFGMTGGLAYEVHGDTENAREVHKRLIEVGNKYGIRMMGVQSYMMCHTPGGSVQFNLHYSQYLSQDMIDILFAKSEDKSGFTSNDAMTMELDGSVGTHMEDRYKNPYEVGLGKLIDYSHDFPGRDALLEYSKDIKRTLVTLKWNADDIGDVFASQVRDGEPYFPMDHPGQMSLVDHKTELSMDYVFDKDGNCIGTSGGRTFSPWHQAMLSLASIDLAYTQLGTEVQVLWGNEGSRQKLIRATVEPVPYNTNYSNRTYDVEQIPHFKKA
jgi:glycine cleavage system aminomethyltransferase T